MPAYQFVFSADKSLSAAGISLASRAAKELPIDAARLMSLGGDNMKSAHCGDALAQPDVRSPPSHVRSNRNTARLSCECDDEGFFGQAGGIEDLEGQTARFEQMA